MMIINMIYLGLACLISHLSPSDHASGVAETQHGAASGIATPLSIVAMPTTGRLLLRIPAIDEVAPASSNNDNNNNNKAIDATATPVVAQEPSSAEADGVPAIPAASAFPVVEARLNVEVEEETSARVYINDNPKNNPRERNVLPLNDGSVVLRMPSDPLLVWEVDAVLLLAFLRNQEASVPVGYNPDYDLEQPMREVLPLTPGGRVVFRHPSDPYTVWSVDALALFVFICDCRSAFAYHYDTYYYGANRDELLQSATAIDADDDDSNSHTHTHEPMAQADETPGGDDHSGNATESSQMLRIAIYRIAVYCLVWFVFTWDGFLTKPEWTKQEQPAPQPREVKIRPFWEQPPPNRWRQSFAPFGNLLPLAPSSSARPRSMPRRPGSQKRSRSSHRCHDRKLRWEPSRTLSSVPSDNLNA